MHPWRPKVVRARQFLTLLTSKCASRHNGVQRALFWHRNFQKCRGGGGSRSRSRSESVVVVVVVAVLFCTFWLRFVGPIMVCFVHFDWRPRNSFCASCHNGVHFFNISTSKSSPTLACFVHFDFQMCFAPQRRALFRHLNFWKWSDFGVFCTFWLPNVLRATTTCNFSSLIWPDGSGPAALASLLFDPPELQIYFTFLRTCVFFLLTLSLLWFSLFFSSLLFSDSSHLCFSICRYCRKFD